MAKFYTIIVVLSIGWLIFTFKDQIKEYSFKPQKLHEISNQTELTVILSTIKVKHPLVTGTALYLLQPKEDSYFKTLMFTDVSYMKENDFFKSIPLNTQKYLNYRLIGKESVLFEYTSIDEKTYTDMYASDYILFINLKVGNGESIGELILFFNVRPTDDEISVIDKELRTIKYYII